MTALATRREDVRFQGAECDGCGEVFPKAEFDEDRWCSECWPRLQRRLAVWQHVVAITVVLPFAFWVLLVEKFDFLPPGAWLLPLAAAYYLGFRIGREVVKGYTRWLRTR